MKTTSNGTRRSDRRRWTRSTANRPAARGRETLDPEDLRPVRAEKGGNPDIQMIKVILCVGGTILLCGMGYAVYHSRASETIRSSHRALAGSSQSGCLKVFLDIIFAPLIFIHRLNKPSSTISPLVDRVVAENLNAYLKEHKIKLHEDSYKCNDCTLQKGCGKCIFTMLKFGFWSGNHSEKLCSLFDESTPLRIHWLVARDQYKEAVIICKTGVYRFIPKSNGTLILTKCNALTFNGFDGVSPT